MTLSWLTDSITTDLDRALHYALLWGVEALDLRMLSDGRVPHVNEEKLRRRLAEAELEVASIQPGVFEGAFHDRATWLNDIAVLPDSLSFCRRLGCGIIIVSGFRHAEDVSLEDTRPAFERLSDAASRADVSLAVMNDPEGLIRTGADLAELLALVDRPNLVAAWNPAAALRAGEDPEDGLRRLGDRVRLLRCSDIKRSADGSWELAPLGEGEVGWTNQLRTLSKPFEGVTSLEAFADPPKKQAVRDATWMIRTWRTMGGR